MSKEKVNISADKIDVPEDKIQEIARQALVSAGLMNPRVKRVRIPKRFEDLNLNWIAKAPFFSEFLFRFNYLETFDIPTAAVSVRQGCINFYYNPKFYDGGGMRPVLGPDKRPIIKLDAQGQPMVDSKSNLIVEMEVAPPMSDPEFEGLVLHEIEHLIRLHIDRSLADHNVFNIAGDMLINDSITKLEIDGRRYKPAETIMTKDANGKYTCKDTSCISLPSGGVYLEQAKKHGYIGKEVTEELYYWLLEKKEEKQEEYSKMLEKMSQNKFTSEDQGEGYGDLFDVLFGSGMDVHISQTSDQSAKDTIGSLIEAAKMRGWGKVTGAGRAMIEELIAPKKIPWRQLLNNALSSYIHGYGNERETTWAHRNRRGIPIPDYRRLENRIFIAMDVSGSIQQHEVKTFFGQIERIVKDAGQMTVCQWDTRIVDVWKKYKKGDWKKIKMKGGGGTSVQCIFDYMVKNGHKRDMLVVFTDGYFDMGFDSRGIKTLWCVTTTDVKVPFGKNIYCEILDHK